MVRFGCGMVGFGHERMGFARGVAEKNKGNSVKSRIQEGLGRFME